jgi:NAD(P)-dependent dehydrogenase (short-subunit alcohol dehydrogenase family)
MATIAADLAAENIEAVVEHCDVTSTDSLDAFANSATERLGGLDLVFANAGIGAGETGAM